MNMKKRLIFVFLMIVVLGGLTGLVLFFKKINAKPAASRPTFQYIMEYSTIPASVTIRNSYGEFTIVSNDADNPVIAGYEESIKYTGSLKAALNLSKRLAFQELVTEDPEETGAFGFAPPSSTVRINPVEGDELILLIGAASPEGSGRYVKKDGAPEIYLVSSKSVEAFLVDPVLFIDPTVISPAKMENNRVLFEQITLGGSVRKDAQIRIIRVDPGSAVSGMINNPYRIISPVEERLSLDKGLLPLEKIFGLVADRVVGKISGEGDLQKYGLDDPWSTISAQGNFGEGYNSVSIRVSKPDSVNDVFIWKEGSPVIYETNSLNLPWRELSWFDIMDKIIILPRVESLSAITVRTADRSVSFTFSGEGSGFKITAGNITVDPEIFSPYYQTLLMARYNENPGAGAASLSSPILEIIYRYNDGTTDDVISFYPASSRRVLTSLNGKRPYITFSAYVDKLIADLDLVLEGKKVTPYL